MVFYMMYGMSNPTWHAIWRKNRQVVGLEVKGRTLYFRQRAIRTDAVDIDGGSDRGE